MAISGSEKGIPNYKQRFSNSEAGINVKYDVIL